HGRWGSEPFVDRGEPLRTRGSPQLTCFMTTACAWLVNLVNLFHGVDDFAARRGSLKSTAPGRSGSAAHTQRPRGKGSPGSPSRRNSLAYHRLKVVNPCREGFTTPTKRFTTPGRCPHRRPAPPPPWRHRPGAAGRAAGAAGPPHRPRAG